MKIKLKKIRITKRFIIESVQTIAILALFAILGIWYAYGSRAGSPKRYVLQYFEYFLTGNYEEMYKMVDVTESTFVNKKYYAQMMEGQAVTGGISDYKIVKGSSDGDLYKYTINYTRKDGIKGSMDVTLEKQPKRTYLVFNTWKVNIDNNIINKYTVGIPSEMSGQIDGIKLDEYYDNTSLDGTMKYYILFRIMDGEHTFTISADDMDTYNETVYMEASEAEKNFELSSIKMVPSEEEEVLKYSRYVINQMYEHALEGADFSSVQGLFANSEKRLSAIGYLYDNMVAWSVGDNGAKLNTFTIDKISSKIRKFTYPKETMVQVSYNYSYTALDERTMLTANQNTREGKGKAKATIYFRKNKAGEWKIIRVVMKLPDYTGDTEE